VESWNTMVVDKKIVGFSRNFKIDSEKLAKLLISAYMSFLIIIPMFFQELYPFTIVPMFRDAPRQYATYKVLSSAGDLIPNHEVTLHQNYDGNPVGLGAGVLRRQTANKYGYILSSQEIVQVVKQHLSPSEYRYPITVEQSIYGLIPGSKRFGAIDINKLLYPIFNQKSLCT